MSSGLPIVATKASGIQDVLEPFPEHMFYPDDFESFKNLIINILSNKNYQKGEQLRKQIIENYSISKEVLKHEAIYKSCLNL